MFQKIAYTTAVVTLILAFFQNANGIDLESTKEGPCLDIKEIAYVDLNWLASHKMWYYPLMSRFDIYHVSTDMSGRKAKDIREDEIYYNSCIHYGLAGNTYYAEAFGNRNRRVPYKVDPIKGFGEYKFTTGVEGNIIEGGKCYTTLTDNKTFMVGACCIGDSQRTWAVTSTVKQLPEETNKLIYDHVESLGYKREHFTAFRYESCKDLESEDSVKNEL